MLFFLINDYIALKKSLHKNFIKLLTIKNKYDIILNGKWRSRLARFMAHDWNSCMG